MCRLAWLYTGVKMQITFGWFQQIKIKEDSNIEAMWVLYTISPYFFFIINPS
jgi:hypothetical protein